MFDLDPGLLGSDESAQSFLELAVAEALERLPAPHRSVVKLRLEGYEVAEIARATGRSKRSVERLLQECRSHLASWREAV